MEDKVINLGQKSNQEPNEFPKKTSEAAQLAAQHEIPEEFIDKEFSTPTDIVELPSGGQFYPGGQKSVEIRYLTAEDENILMSPELIKNGKVLDVLLETAIVQDLRNPDSYLHPEDMLVGDRNAVLLALRSTGYGDDYETKMVCPKCTKEYLTKVKLSELGYKLLDVQPDGNNEFNVLLPTSKRNIKFRLLNGKDESYLNKVSERAKRIKGSNIQVSKGLTERYLLQIMQVGETRDKGYISSFISKMPIADSLFFREYVREIEPGVNMEHEFECKECGHEYEDTVQITAKLFWPNAKV